MRRLSILGLAAVLLVFGACGDDGNDASGGDAAGGDLDRYCEISSELDKRGEKAFEEAPDDASEVDVLKKFFADNDELFDELREVAPEEVRNDIETVYKANQDFIAGDESAAEKAEPADDRLTDYNEKNC